MRSAITTTMRDNSPSVFPSPALIVSPALLFSAVFPYQDWPAVFASRCELEITERSPGLVELRSENAQYACRPLIPTSKRDLKPASR